MREVREFSNVDEMKRYIADSWNRDWETPLFDESDIVIEKDGFYDDRNGWRPTKYVCVKRMGDEDYMEKFGTPQCIGYCHFTENPDTSKGASAMPGASAEKVPNGAKYSFGTWVKVTPETLPPDKEPVLATICYPDSVDNMKAVWADVRYNHDSEKWEYLSNSWQSVWSDVEGEVTHWMSYPSPAEG